MDFRGEGTMTSDQMLEALLAVNNSAVSLDPETFEYGFRVEWSAIQKVMDALAQSDNAPNPSTPAGGQEGVGEATSAGPQLLPARYTCKGCVHLTTKDWEDYLENDETDSGTSARCGAIPDEYGGKSITAYWMATNAPPKWCPFSPIGETVMTIDTPNLPRGASDERVPADVAARQLMGLYYELSGMPDMAADVRSDNWEAGSGFGPGSERELLAVMAALVDAVRKEEATIAALSTPEASDKPVTLTDLYAYEAGLADGRREASEETCPICEGREMGPGEGCLAGCRDGKVLWTSANVLRNVKFWMDADRREIDRLRADTKGLVDALEKIERWHGEFPDTGKFWDDETGRPMSYAACFGSNGERDFMREIAREALAQHRGRV